MIDAIFNARENVIKKRRELSAARDEFDNAGLAFSRKVVNLLYDSIQGKTGIDPFFYTMHKEEQSDIGAGDDEEQNYHGQIHFICSVSFPTFVAAFLDRIDAKELRAYTENSRRGFGHGKVLKRDLETLLQLLRENGYGDENMSLMETLSDNPRAMAFAAGFDDVRGLILYNEKIAKDAERRNLEMAEKICPGFGEDYKLGHLKGYDSRGDRALCAKYRQQHLNFCLRFDPEDTPVLSFLVNIGGEACPNSARDTNVPWQFGESLPRHTVPEAVAARIFDAFRFNEPKVKEEERYSPGLSM